MAYEICGFVHPDGTICQGLYDPNNIPPVPCIFPEEEADKLVEQLENLVVI